VTQLAKVSRPQFLIGVRGLFAFGAQWARLSGAPFSWELLVAGWLAVAAAQLSVHFNNDYFDARLDRPGSSTFISGGSGVLAEHPELKRPS
jgi:1,4-dihydroxy-2-naphthoate octaprenyltransferase